MRKIAGIMLIITVVVVAAGVAIHLCLTPLTEWRDVVRTWAVCVSAAGSLGAVIVALFKETLLAKLNAPSLDLDVSNTQPYCLVENAMAGGSSKESGKYIEICAGIKNIGLNSATKCRVICEEIYTMGADEKYSASPEHKFRPTAFPWAGATSCDVDIANGLPSYVTIAEIRTRASELGAGSDPGSSRKTVERPYIVVCLPDKVKRGKYIEFEFDCKSVILPIQLVCAGERPKRKYIKIVWNGKTINDYITDHKKLAVLDVKPDSDELPGKED